MIQPLTTSKPYPSLNAIKRDYRIAKIICEEFAGSHSELESITQYSYFYFNFYRLKDKSTCELLQKIRLCEENHFQTLGEMLVKLGVDPVLTAVPPFKCDYFSTSYLSYSKTPAKMLKDALCLEMTSIARYKVMLTLIDQDEVKGVIERILDDELLHQVALKERLKQITEKQLIKSKVE